MSIGDKLIIAGAVTVPLVLAVFAGAVAMLADEANDRELAFFVCVVSVSVAVAAGLITSGILMRKNRS
jgi:hypothetical protein